MPNALCLCCRTPSPTPPFTTKRTSNEGRSALYTRTAKWPPTMRPTTTRLLSRCDAGASEMVKPVPSGLNDTTPAQAWPNRTPGSSRC
jgi:hypothetical protein